MLRLAKASKRCSKSFRESELPIFVQSLDDKKERRAASGHVDTVDNGKRVSAVGHLQQRGRYNRRQQCYSTGIMPFSRTVCESLCKRRASVERIPKAFRLVTRQACHPFAECYEPQLVGPIGHQHRITEDL